MDRMRAGLTGLGLVFLVTLTASALVANKPREAAPEKGGEPLAQLGVAPGQEKELGADSAAARAPLPAASE